MNDNVRENSIQNGRRMVPNLQRHWSQENETSGCMRCHWNDVLLSSSMSYVKRIVRDYFFKEASRVLNSF